MSSTRTWWRSTSCSSRRALLLHHGPRARAELLRLGGQRRPGRRRHRRREHGHRARTPAGSGPGAGERPPGAPRQDPAALRASLVQLVKGVDAIHRAGKLHRDLKPSNVLVTERGRVVILDFGLVAELDRRRRRRPRGHMCGTPRYMSPEQAAGQPAQPASDWYSVGVMLFEALTGQLPSGARASEVMTAKQSAERPLAAPRWSTGLPRRSRSSCASACWRWSRASGRARARVLALLGQAPRRRGARAGARPVGREPALGAAARGAAGGRRAGTAWCR